MFASKEKNKEEEIPFKINTKISIIENVNIFRSRKGGVIGNKKYMPELIKLMHSKGIGKPQMWKYFKEISGGQFDTIYYKAIK